MKHIADLVGVSQSTVSRVLSSAATNVPVAAATRERIHQVVAELGYTPNLMARALSTARSGLIGVIVRDINDPFFATGIAAITREARAHGYSVVLGHVESRAEQAVALTEALAMGHCDGVILFGDVRGQAKLWPRRAGRLPVVGLWLGGGSTEVPVVNVDNRAGVVLAVDHLIALGHTRIAFLQGGRTADGVQRRAAFIAALRERGLQHPERAVHVSSNEFLSTARAAEAMLQGSDRPSAIVASTDVAAIGAMKGAARQGLRVPQDVSIVGFDDIAMAEVTIPSLTTVQQPMAQLTRLAIERLLSLMSNPFDRDADVRLVQPKLVVRESTAPPARA
jgi:LacI family transcriptional regulator